MEGKNRLPLIQQARLRDGGSLVGALFRVDWEEKAKTPSTKTMSGRQWYIGTRDMPERTRCTSTARAGSSVAKVVTNTV